MSSRRPLSLITRSTLATGLALIAFLGLAGLSLDRAYFESARAALRDRLQGYVYAYLASTDVGRGGRVLSPDSPPPHSDFLQPGSGLYAVIDGDNGYHWESPSAVGRRLGLQEHLRPGENSFRGPVQSSVGGMYIYSLGVAYDDARGQPVDLTFTVAQTETQFVSQLSVYRRTLYTWLAALGLVLLLLQLLLLRWSLFPLRRVSSDLARVDRGDSDRLEGAYPIELSGLTHSLNNFIENERRSLTRNRNILADLAHSLKTPLAVVRSRLELGDVHDEARKDITDQVQRMDDIVAYQLSRGASSGVPTFVAPVEVAAHAEDLVQGLEKVHASRNVLCEFEIEVDARFYGEAGDLLEILGNLLENAFKWAQHRVLLSARPMPERGKRRPGLEICVEDDGPGIDADQVERILQRGVRGDERVQGHGIGLSIVQDIVNTHNATLEVARSDELGGAQFRIHFSAV
ncbi:sensor histidine kinase [Oleiagrimonas soli]|nr:sensor histidine kinase [Oleiagrimonas soli]MBB6184314.1 two-component system sensor histidine kinase PhoQ [Oleiagrimonas soli]